MEGSSTLRGSHILKSMSFRSNNVSLHIDARIAIVLVFVYSVALFLADSWMALGLFAVGLFAVLVAARVSFVKVMRGMVPLLFILAFTVVAHIPQGIIEGSFYAFRIFLLAVATVSVAFSYDDTRLVRAFTFFLFPFRKACVPVDDIATMFSIALRFIPVSMDEFQRVSSAQRARGANLDEGDVIERVKNWGSGLVPMLVGLFRRAGVLAQAMEARCYGGCSRRTSLHGDEKLGAPAVASMLLLCVAIVSVALLL